MHMQSDCKPSASIEPDPLPGHGAEVIDSAQLAQRLGVPESWVRSHTNPNRTGDVIPHVRLGRYIRFLWGSDELRSWLKRRLVSTDRQVIERRLK
jgi:hypothetical protein